MLGFSYGQWEEVGCVCERERERALDKIIHDQKNEQEMDSSE